MIAVGERKNKGRKKKEREKMSSFLFALRVNPFPTLEVITPRYIVGSARGTINRLQRSFFFSSPLREIAQSSSAPFPSSDRGRENFQKKRKEERIHSMNFRSDSSSTQRARFLSSFEARDYEELVSRGFGRDEF